MSKKIFLFLLLGLFILGGVLIYFLVREKQSISPATLPKVIKIFEKEALFPVLSKDENNILYYAESRAVFYQFVIETKSEKAISPLLSFIQKTVWSPDTNEVILKVENLQAAKTESIFYTTERPYESLTTWLYNFKTQEKALLNQNIQEVTWTADGQKIVYQYLDKTKGVNGLYIADPDGKNWKKLIDLKDETIFLNALGTGEIAYTNSETTDGFSVIKTDGSGKRTIKLPISVNINKITWSSDGKSVIAAIREANKTTDSFYKITLETNQKEEIKYKSDLPIDAKNLMLTKGGKILYFTSDDYLFSLSL